MRSQTKSRINAGRGVRATALGVVLVMLLGTCAAGVWAESGGAGERAEAGKTTDGAEAEAERLFEVLFGERLKAARATPDRTDDAELAKLIAESATALGDKPALQRLCLEKAVALGEGSPQGYATAIAAAEKLIEVDEANALKWRQKLLDLRQAAYRTAPVAERRAAAERIVKTAIETGDRMVASGRSEEAIGVYRSAMPYVRFAENYETTDVGDRILRARARAAVDAAVSELAESVRATQSKEDARRLVRLIVGEYGDGERASEFAGMTGDASLGERLSRLGKSADAMAPEAAADQAEWWQVIADEVSDDRKLVALERAATLYESVVDRVDAGVVLVKAKVELKSVESAIATLEEKLATDDRRLLRSRYRVVVYNQHNAGSNDRGTTKINVIAYRGDKAVVGRKGVDLKWARSANPSVTVDLGRVNIDRVRVEVVEIVKEGGGLAEVEVYRDKELISRGKPTRASASYSVHYGPSNVVDGIKNSARHRQGYWLLPSQVKPGWVEIDLDGEAKQKKAG